jgi:hypothetical protein
MKEHLPVLTPQDEVALLRAAGFEHVELFYADRTFKGWGGYRSWPPPRPAGTASGSPKEKNG